MSLPKPEPGLVISYAYLWRHEHHRGLEEGRQHRPCVTVLAGEKAGIRATRVTVASVTHTPQPLMPLPWKCLKRSDSISGWTMRDHGLS
ncbi:hypothetical protein [Acetobacter indonesiensis]|uniref:hypothetical protein n=1 Tax=Acetobacter indonesiensis TaxID=104101 RepID=UPI00211ACB6F|nr:hypothetical protein [Acetobacter indonesiensis]